MSISGGKSYNNSNTSGSNTLQDILTQVNQNTQKLTGITYTPTPTPTTKLVNNLDITGQLIIRDTTDPNINMGIFYLPAGAGFRFINNVLNGYMYFSVKDGAGNIKNFQFSSSQFYANMPMYCDNNFNVSFNHDFTLGDTNFTTSWIGGRIKYIPNSSVTSGLVFYNKGLNNNTVYYTNFTHNDLTNTEIPTLRMNYNNIWSKVPHTFENGINLIGGDLLLTNNLIVNSTTISSTQLSYLSGLSNNVQTQLNSKLNLTGGTISGNISVSGTSNLQTTVINGTCTAQITEILIFIMIFIYKYHQNYSHQVQE